MTVKMILRDGPLDGEQQIVAALPTDPGSLMYFVLPAYQQFDDDGNYLGIGLTAVYILLGQGNAPITGDTWDSSWIFVFGTELPTPPAGTQVWMVPLSDLSVVGTTVPAPPSQFVSMYVGSNMIVNAQDPILGPVVITMEADTTLVTDIFPIPYGIVNMSGETVLTADGTDTPPGG